MPKFLDTSGNNNLGIGICDRCKMKRPLVKLGPDGNLPGLRVCQDKEGCKDEFDPYRLPVPNPDRVVLPFTRPDLPIGVQPATEQQGPFRVTQQDEFRTTQDEDFRTVEGNN